MSTPLARLARIAERYGVRSLQWEHEYTRRGARWVVVGRLGDLVCWGAGRTGLDALHDLVGGL